MKWKVKAKIQNTISLFPSALSYSIYYWIQRHFGGLKKKSPVVRLTNGIETWKHIQNESIDPTGKVFLEIGTGRVPVVPISYWLMGAKKIITIDLNPYMKAELIKENLQFIQDNKNDIEELFGTLLLKDRLEELVKFNQKNIFSIKDFYNLCCIEYIAPCDATKTGLPESSIDFHTSNAVLEHIPKEVLKDILIEGNRIIKDKGLFVHNIDYSDHFSHSDKTISAINFLQFSDLKWDKYAGNRYMYMNRLRHDDYIQLFQSVEQRILTEVPNVDSRSNELLKSETFQLNDRFKSKSIETLSTRGAWILTQKQL